MTIARKFTALISIPFLLVMTFAATRAYQLANLSKEGARLSANLQHTAILSQNLARDTVAQTDALQRLFVQLDPSFVERAETLNYAVGEKYTEYLKLDIGDQERLTVETVKALQAEVSIMSMQIYEQLRSGARAEASARVLRLYRVQGQIDDEFKELNGLQIEKLRAVMDHLNSAATRGLVDVFILVSALVAVMGAAAFLLRRRILQPVRAILDASDRIRRGDLAARAPAGRTDEFGQLMQGFNFMAEALAESHGGLERKVEERTLQLREMQDQLIRAEKMSAVGLLVSGVAHELNNPLAAIRGFVEMVKTDIGTRRGNAKGLAMLEEVDSQVERCRGIIVNLLQFTRQQEPHLEAIDINAVLDQVLRFREYELKTSNTTLVREFDPGNPLLLADASRIQQVFLNLLNNACDAVHETGRPGTIWVRTRTESDSIVVEFLDDGPGFRQPEHAFDPFYTTKEVGKGTGLGLSICHGILQEHQGDIRARNWEHGAQVTVTLPIGDPKQLQKAAPEARPPAEQARAEPAAARELCALIVDDEEMLVRIQISFLSKMGIKAVGAATGEEGRKYLQSHHVDIVLSDVRMPGRLNGVQLYEWIRQNQPHLANRFIFVSGDLVGLNLGEFFQKSAVPRVQKPFTYNGYSQVIRQVLESGALVR